jgi:azurin
MILAGQFAHAEPAENKDAPKDEKKMEAAAENADVKVTITGDDTMKFDKTTFEVKEGQVVALTFKNVGKLPKAAMGHNVVILQPDTEPMAFSAAATPNMTTTGLPTDEKMLESVIASTKILGPGESETITFTAPEAGGYAYICTFPGHAALMKGVMTVKPKE